MSDYNYNNPSTENASDEITLKELVGKVKEYYQEVKSKWKTVAYFCLFTLSLMAYRYFTTDTEYKATLTFMVNNPEGGSGMAGAASILSSLGVGGVDKDNLDKILALSKSMHIINEAIVTKVRIGDDYDYLGNHIIKEYELQTKDWKKSKIGLQTFFFKRSGIDSFNLQENAAIKTIFSKIAGSETTAGMMSNSQSRQTQIMTMNVTSTSEELSIQICKTIYDKLSSFYINKALERETETYRVVKLKADSIKRALSGADYAAANFEDSHRGLFLETVRIPNKQLGRDVGRLTVMYGEAVKNLEITDFAMKNKRPYVQIIDEPFSPLSPSTNSWKKAIAIGLALGGILGSLYVVVRKILRESLS